MNKKKNQNMRSAEDRRDKQNGAGANSKKSRPDVPATKANKAMTGKQIFNRDR